MVGKEQERRKFDRYKTEVEVYFDFVYDVETKVKFELIDEEKGTPASKKYSAISRNVSVGGLCFASNKKVRQDDLLHLEVYLPGGKKPVDMKGRVEWCKPVAVSAGEPAPQAKKGQFAFEVGVKLMFVNGHSVSKTIYHDKTYNVDWSIVLESVFGSYRMLVDGKFKSETDES